MRFNCALVPSILFVSAVLADFHREKQQPPFLPRVEKPINSDVPVQVPNGTWAGAALEGNPGTVTLATGTFIVPNLQAEVGSESGFNIGVGFDGLTCKSAFFAAGISVTTTRDEVSFIPWGQLWPNDVQAHPDPSAFIISPGDELEVTVQTLSTVTANFTVINYTTGRSWADAFTTTTESQLCQQNAFWVVTAVPNISIPLGNFGTVTFTDIFIGDPVNEVVPSSFTPIERTIQPITPVQLGDGFITIRY